MPEFRDRLNEALRIKNITAAELARLSKVNEGAISQYRKGGYKANQYSLEKIAKALNVSIPWLMGADVPMYDNLPSVQSKADQVNSLDAWEASTIEKSRHLNDAGREQINIYMDGLLANKKYIAVQNCTTA